MLTIDIQRKMLTADGEKTLRLNVEILDRQLVCLFGKSGAGKTTALRMLAGLTKPDAGIIRFDDKLWFSSAQKINVCPQARDVGYMFQDYALFPNMTVEQNIRYGQLIQNQSEVENLLTLFDLVQLRRQKPLRLSGGQKQRCALARALARKPKLLLLDEPLSSLDEEMRFALQDEILKAHRHLGVTTLMISHDRTEIDRMADFVISIVKGECEVAAFTGRVS
ncbi:MAG: ATP-binding cassette domain-containing protein [Dysgonamonadaceae bacterium]|jgi:molybdate transport system ATP-binding protein|nr:ATP-binding cassette domain-containing protein [Dysgonamonadaceae bacterium]